MLGRPSATPEDVPRILEFFGIAVGDGLELKELPAYEDQNFRVRPTASGERYVLKLHNAVLPSGTRERLEAQNRLIRRLKEQGLPVPAVVVAPSGESIFPMEPPAPDAPAPLARLLTYLDGEVTPNETPKDAPFLQDVGRTVGRVASALAGFEDPGAHWTWGWDMKFLSTTVYSKLQFITDESRRALASRLAGEYRDTLESVADTLPHSVLHADLNDTNLLYRDGEMVGIIDFGDSIYGCTVFDVAIAAAYFSLGQAEPMTVFCEVLRGYLQTAPAKLTEAELSAYFQAARGRVLLSVSCSAEGSFLEPDNEYLAHTAEPGWAVLEKIGGVTAEDALVLLTEVARG